MKKLKYGMVGGGPGSFIGDAHRKAINIDAMSELVAGCFSRTLEKCRQTGEELGIDPERCYASFDEMAKAEAAREDGIDFVVVVTPNVSHYPVCKAFLEAGINVSCDKPLCFTVEQAEELERIAKEKGLLFLVTYTYMGHVTAKHIRAFIKAGKLGKIRTVMAEYPQGWLSKEGEWGGKQGEWRCDPKQSGGVNCLGALGTHIENAPHETLLVIDASTGQNGIMQAEEFKKRLAKGGPFPMFTSCCPAWIKYLENEDPKYLHNIQRKLLRKSFNYNIIFSKYNAFC